MRVDDYLKITNYQYYDIRSRFGNEKDVYDDKGNVSKGLAIKKYGNFHIDEISDRIVLEGIIDKDNNFCKVIKVIPVLWISE